VSAGRPATPPSLSRPPSPGRAPDPVPPPAARRYDRGVRKGAVGMAAGGLRKLGGSARDNAKVGAAENQGDELWGLF